MPSDLRTEAEMIHLLCIIADRVRRTSPMADMDEAHEVHIREITARLERIAGQRPPTGRMIEKA